jgi:polyisoprenoid-binding protein YceI
MSITEQTLPTGTWELDPVHSKASFAVKHAGLSSFRGHFNDLTARLSDESGTPTLTGAVKVASVEVPVEQLKGHLQGPDFFDAEQHPQLTFVAKDLTGSGDDVRIQGEITIKGHTEPVEIRGAVTEPQDDPFGNVRFGLKLEAKIDRTVFGVSWNNPLPSGEPALQNEVTLIADLQFVKQS